MDTLSSHLVVILDLMPYIGDKSKITNIPRSGGWWRSVAAAEAARRGTGVLAIHVWNAAATWGVPLAWPAGHNPGEFVRKRLTEEAGQLQAARQQAGEPPVTVSVEVIEGDTERELRTAGKDAPMLVLGERRHRGPTAVLGSVVGSLVAHPPCPILIVPARDHS